MLLVAAVVIIVLWFMWTQSKRSKRGKTAAPVDTTPQSALISTAGAMSGVVSGNVPAVITNDTAVMKCGGGLYCDGSVVPDELSMVGGDAICGTGNFLYSCVNSLGTARWRTDRDPCAAAAKGACPADSPLVSTTGDNAVGVDAAVSTSST